MVHVMDGNTGQRHHVGHLSDAVPQRELDRCGRCPPPHCCHPRLGRRGWKVFDQLLNLSKGAIHVVFDHSLKPLLGEPHLLF